MKKAILSLFVITSAFLFSTNSVAAINLPEFPSCAAPEGTLIADYKDGYHGVIGQSQAIFGSDRVYKLDDQRVLQCFCYPDDGSRFGIATVFWKFGQQLTSQDIDSLKNQGWFYIPSGSLWGLDTDPYVARNYEFTCRGDDGDGGTGGGEVLGVSTYADSGNNKELLLVSAAAGLLLLSLLALKFKRS
jgi:hypothetical protein